MVMEGNEFYMNGERLDILQTRWDRAAQQVIYLARDGKGTEWTITLPVLRAVEGREAFYKPERPNLSKLVGEHGPELLDKEEYMKKLGGLKSGSLEVSGYFDVPLYSPPAIDDVVVLDVPSAALNLPRQPSIAEATAYVVPARLSDPTQPDGMETMDAWFRRCFKIEMGGEMSSGQTDVTPQEGSSPAGESTGEEDEHEMSSGHNEQNRENDLPQLEVDGDGSFVQDVTMDTVTFPLGNDLLQLKWPVGGDEHRDVHATSPEDLERIKEGLLNLAKPEHEESRWEDDGGHASS